MNIRDRWESLGPEVGVLLDLAARLADAPVYLVGGAVRDLLLGRPVLDIDIAVEGHALGLVTALARHYGVPCKTHSRFQTGTLHLASGLQIDVAMTRRETYAGIATLPTVTPASIDADLARRDFSINALAARLDGTVLDLHGGVEDLRRGWVRVLHPQSFKDDPTRIFRAVRFEQRFGFSLEAETESLARHARQAGFLQHVSPFRLKDEMLHVLQEEQRLACLERLSELDLLTVFHPDLKVVPRRFNGLSETLSRPQDVVGGYGAALVSTLSATAWSEVCRRFSLQAEVRHVGPFDHLRRRLLRARFSPGAAYMALRGLSETTLAYVEGRLPPSPLRQRVHVYRTRSRSIEPLVRGRDLQAWGYPPGPAMARLRDELLAAQIDGHFSTLEGARLYAQTHVGHGHGVR